MSADGEFDFDAKSAPDGEPVTTAGVDPAFEDKVIEALKTVRDPEIPANLVDLGLIYEFRIDPPGSVYIEMTLTTPACPVAGSLPGEVEKAVGAVEGVTDVKVELVWMPPWDPSRMTEEVKLELGML